MAKRKIGSFSFVVYGSAIVENAREMALSGEWQKAMNSLRENVCGFTLDHAMSVLSGEMTLTGNSGDDNIALVEDEDSAKYKQEMKEVYLSDLFYENGQLFKIDRVIEDLEVRDMMKHHETYFDAHFPPDEQLNFIERYGKIGRNEFVFRIHSMQYLVAVKVDPNCYPLWFKLSDYHKSHVSCNNARMGIEPVKVKPVVKTESVSSSNSGIKDLIKKNNKDYIDRSANENNYQSAKEMSDELREKIMSLCNEKQVTWEEVEVKNDAGDDVKVSVPKEIVLGYLSKDHKVWNPVCPSGLKMENDSPWHSDLWLALGNDISEDAYDHNHESTQLFYRVINHYHFQKNNEIADFVCLNDLKLKQFEGNIVFEDSKKITDRDILVLPNAGLKYESIAKKAGLVICETGGQLSHLVMMGKEEMLPVILMKDAIRKLKGQYSVMIDFEKKKIIGCYI